VFPGGSLDAADSNLGDRVLDAEPD
jgi:hypothetical protein